MFITGYFATYFVVYCPDSKVLIDIHVPFDYTFWTAKMENNLQNFYF